jgi:membrane peptidoglycan carboxypeptidase
MVNVEGFPSVFGGTIPALIWHDFMTDVTEGMPVVGFPSVSYDVYADAPPPVIAVPSPSAAPAPSPEPSQSPRPSPSPEPSPKPSPTPSSTPSPTSSPGTEADDPTVLVVATRSRDP